LPGNRKCSRKAGDIGQPDRESGATGRQCPGPIASAQRYCRQTTRTLARHKLRHALTAEDRRVVRNWAWGVRIVYSACALTIFGFASLSQHSADASKDAAATAVTATADRNQRTR